MTKKTKTSSPEPMQIDMSKIKKPAPKVTTTELSQEAAEDLLNSYMIYKGSERVDRTTGRRVSDLIEKIESISEDLGDEVVSVTAYQVVPVEQEGRKGLQEAALVRGSLDEVLARLRSMLLTKEQAASAMSTFMQSMFEQSGLKSVSYTAVFEEDGPQVTGASLTAADADDTHFNVQVNSMVAHLERLKESISERGVKLIEQAGRESNLILPGDVGFQRP